MVAGAAFGVVALVGILGLVALLPRDPDPGPAPPVPTGYRVVRHLVWDGEVGKVEGRRVQLVAVEPPASVEPTAASLALCRSRGRGGRIERQVDHCPSPTGRAARSTTAAG